MKNLRRNLALVLLLAFLLSGCGVDTPKPTEQVSTTGGTEPEATGTTVTTSPAPTVDVDITVKTDGWSNLEGYEGRLGLFAYGGYYHCALIGACFLSFMDTGNGVSVVLCAKPGCKHHEETTAKKQEACDAYLHHANQFLHVYDDKIYYTGLGEGNRVTLYRRNLDGTGMEQIAELGTPYVTSKTSADIYSFIPSGGRVYYKVEVNESIRGEDGVYTVKTTKRALMCFDLNAGEEVLIGEFTEDVPHLLAAREDQLLWYTLEGLKKLDSKAPDYFEKLQQIPVRLDVWDASVGQRDTVFEKPYSEWTGNGFVMDGKFHYNATVPDAEGKEFSGWFAYDLGTGQAEVTDRSTQPAGGRYLIYGSPSGGGSKVYDVQKEEYLDNGFAGQGLDVIESGDEGIILSISYMRQVDESFWEGIKVEFVYVPYAALEDGLQSADCRIIHTREYRTQ